MKIWFTSDTHFGAKRTLELSKRPFETVKEMDNCLIENWNKKVSSDDFIYHLGDFGDFNNLKNLNGKIILLLGNYEENEMRDKFKNDFISYHKFLKEKGFYEIIRYPTYFNIENNRLNDTDNKSFFICHKPIDCKPGRFNLFGHIHAAQMIKKFGLNVGVDCHHFYPINIDTILFYKTAIEKYYDINVFL